MDVILDAIDMGLLISLISERPVIWDKTLEDYKFKNVTNAAWREVCVELYPEFESLTEMDKETLGKGVFKKWKNVRDNYFKYVKKLRTGAGGKPVKKYHLFDQLSFLNKLSIKNTKKKSFLSPEEAAGVKKTHKKNRKKKLDFCCHFMEENDRHLSFFKGILPTLQSFNEQQILRFQCGVLQLLSEIQYSPLHTSGTSAVTYPEAFTQYHGLSDERLVPSPHQTAVDVRVKMEARKEFYLP